MQMSYILGENNFDGTYDGDTSLIKYNVATY